MELLVESGRQEGDTDTFAVVRSSQFASALNKTLNTFLPSLQQGRDLDFPLKPKTSFRLIPFFETIESCSWSAVRRYKMLAGAHRKTVV